MIKTTLASLALASAIASSAAAQFFGGYDVQERQILGARMAATAAGAAAQYSYSTGFAGPLAGAFVANTYNTTWAQTVNFNANLPYNGGFGTGYPYPSPCVQFAPPVYVPVVPVAAPVWAPIGGCGPRGGWSVGVNVGVGFGGSW